MPGNYFPGNFVFSRFFTRRASGAVIFRGGRQMAFPRNATSEQARRPGAGNELDEKFERKLQSAFKRSSKWAFEVLSKRFEFELNSEVLSNWAQSEPSTCFHSALNSNWLPKCCQCELKVIFRGVFTAPSQCFKLELNSKVDPYYLTRPKLPSFFCVDRDTKSIKSRTRGREAAPRPEPKGPDSRIIALL